MSSGGGLGFFAGIKDWASKKLASTEFVQYVEQATDERLLQPNYDMYMVLVDAANDPKGEWVADVVRSVRVRMEVANPKVKLFTLELISVLVQNCGLKFHSEMAQSAGLLDEIITIACLRQDRVRGPLAEARKTAIQLIVNLDVWFKHHPAREKTQPLAEMINDAKSRGCIIENVMPDTTTQIITEKYPRRSGALDTHRSGQEIMGANAGVPAHNADPNIADAAVPHTTQRNAQRQAAYQMGHPGAGAGAGHHYPGGHPPPRGAHHHRQRLVRDEVVVVEAIPVEEPSEERRAGMFDTVMLLGEMFHAAQAAGGKVTGDETVIGISQQVQEDFMFVGMLVNSGAKLDQAETLGSLYESQKTVLREVREAREKEQAPHTSSHIATGANAAPQPPQVVSPAGFPSGTPHPAGSFQATVSDPSSAPPVAARAAGAADTAPPPPKPAAKKSAAPTLDELFAESAPPAVDGAFSPASAANQPSPSIPVVPNQQQQHQGDLPVDIPTTVVSSDGTTGTARRSALPEPSQNLNHNQRNFQFDKPPEFVELTDHELHTPKEGPDPAPPQHRSANGTRSAADIDGNGGGGGGGGANDFDAFLNARTGGGGSIQNNN